MEWVEPSLMPYVNKAPRKQYIRKQPSNKNTNSLAWNSVVNLKASLLDVTTKTAPEIVFKKEKTAPEIRQKHDGVITLMSSATRFSPN